MIPFNPDQNLWATLSLLHGKIYFTLPLWTILDVRSLTFAINILQFKNFNKRPLSDYLHGRKLSITSSCHIKGQEKR